MMSTTEGELDVEVGPEKEEGEIEDSDVEEGAYIPLERPESFNPPSLVNMQIQDEHSDEASPDESSGSESDEELRRRPKRTKIRPRRPVQNQAEKKNKYNIWCTALQEDILTEDMVGCDVTKSRRYGVESYDYTIKYRLEDSYISKKPFVDTKASHNIEEHNLSNKRKHADRKNIKHRLGKRENSYKRFDVKQKPRILSDLSVTANDDVEAVALDIAEKLSEEKKDLIRRIVQVLGISKAIEIYEATKNLEADGGVLVMNGTRRRTAGGVYLFLLKQDSEVSQSMVNQIFLEDRKETAKKVKRMRAQSRQKVMEQLKQSLTDSELPSLLSRSESLAASNEHGSNPPPSPATDAKDCSSDTDAHGPTPPHNRHLQEYDDDDDYLEVMCNNDDMDMF
ncbi:Phosphorylated adapter RNA export protein [Eumeta japonica]|uniref:Phosphorylated adapter RNA export protein n=1 Tax=Eumeta variegata TaxID=151549 RepID=A0A4C1Y6C6_EUMVA|nr:Phosphorylated adapter RNA export protein [Eumeta japonica]